MEHEYEIPQKGDVEDAIDISTLFIAASDRVLRFFPSYFEILQKGEYNSKDARYTLYTNVLRVYIDSEEIEIIGVSSNTCALERIVLPIEHSLYLTTIRVLVNLHLEKECEDVIRTWVTHVRQDANQ